MLFMGDCMGQNLFLKMQEDLDNRDNLHSLRKIIVKEQQGPYIKFKGTNYINLSSNDYLGLGQDKNLAQLFLDNLCDDAKRLSSSGSALLTGAFQSYNRALNTVEKLYKRKCVFFNSGFAANSGCVKALLNIPNTLIIADKLSHASIIDGLIGSKHALRYAHNDYEHLRALIKRETLNYENIIVVTEGVFSMDGDKADILSLVKLKEEFSNLYLYIDEAHSFAVFDDLGLGLCQSLGVLDKIDFVLCTCGKGLGSQGAFMLCNETAQSFFINNVRPLIFSTAMSPLCFEHINFMLNILPSQNERRKRLLKISEFIRSDMKNLGFDCVSDSQIIPLLTYENDKALYACEFFKSEGFYALPIRHPTVPMHKARLRISLTESLDDLMVEKLCLTIKKWGKLCDRIS